ncbi:MAG: calcium/sodium antiporter [Planctomycetes bacterium]|nr:calcium/sodium antiporter [Planctomycetota bacterium]
MDWLTLLAFVVGLALLVLGADWLVRGASRLARAAGVSPLVVGLTVVAFGTSAPELAVSVRAAWAGQADMAVGNVVGSNIFNVLAIVGLAAAITPLLVAVQLVRRDVPVMIVVSLALIGLALDGRIGRLDGALLFIALVGYTTWIVRASRREGAAAAAAMDTPASAPRGKLSLDLGFVLGGCAMLVLGSTWMVDGAIAFAKWLGLSEVVVGLTIVAAGTSLPELATSVMAAAKGERDIAVGNVVGSNVFNILGVLGLSGIMAPYGLTVLPSMVTLDLPVMLAAAFACLPFFARGHVIPRWEGVLFLLFYVAYTTWLVMDATQHEAREGYASIMLRFVLPLTAVTLALVAWRVLRLPRD